MHTLTCLRFQNGNPGFIMKPLALCLSRAFTIPRRTDALVAPGFKGRRYKGAAPGQQAGRHESGSKLPHSKALQLTVLAYPFPFVKRHVGGLSPFFCLRGSIHLIRRGIA
jgi:hypothetical protein